MAQIKVNSCWDLFGAIENRTDRILLHGPPGTGKTRQAFMAGANRDQESFQVTLTEETPAAEIRGHYIPRGQEFLWQDGPGIRAWKMGGHLVINEIDLSSADVMTLLHVLLDDKETAALTLPTGDTVRPHKNFTVIATMNGNPEQLPAALRDRFPVTIEINAAHPGAIASLPKDIQGVALATSVLPEERRVSVRSWQAFAALRKDLPIEVAAAAVFGKRSKEVANAFKLKDA